MDITVLLGAFSAYRYIAIQNERSGDAGPLYKYFLGEKVHRQHVSRRGPYPLLGTGLKTWMLCYVKSAYAIIDVPDQAPELISQRRRWLNGSFFGTLTSSFTLSLSLSIMQAHYYITFFILSSALEDPSFGLKGINIANTLLNYFYLGLLIMCSISRQPPSRLKLGLYPCYHWIRFNHDLHDCLSVGTRIQRARSVGKRAQWVVNLGDFFKDAIFRNIVLSLAATLGLYIFASLIFVSRNQNCH